MEINIPQNVKHKLEIKVSIKDTAIQYGSGLIEVFATPAMIGLMEGTAQQSIQQYLPEGAITLGIEIHAKHIKATPVGMTVYCESTLIKTDGKKLFFELIAFDEKGEIGSATHTRYVVDAKKFMEKINT